MTLQGYGHVTADRAPAQLNAVFSRMKIGSGIPHHRNATDHDTT